GEGDQAHADRAQRGARRRRHRPQGDHGGPCAGDARLRPVGHRPKGAAVTGPVLTMAMTEIERHHLLGIVDEFIALLDGPRDAGDAALERLAPDPYPEDAAAADEYRRGTREDLFDQRLADALAVRAALEDFERMTGAEAAAPHPVRLS